VLQITTRTANKIEITTKSSDKAKRTLELKTKKQPSPSSMSFSIKLRTKLQSAAIRTIAGDYTTGHREDGKRRIEVVGGPPSWHTGLEVDEESIPAL
jgi:hypothetical protein